MKKANRVLAVLLAIGMMMSFLPVGSLVSGHPDTEGHWASEAVDRWRGYGVVSGDDSGAFRPDEPITRGEMAKIIAVALKLEVVGENTFEDLDDGAWYAPYVLMCYAAGIMLGDGAGHVRPTDPITRQEACKMLAIALGIAPVSEASGEGFADGDAIDAWAMPYVNALYEAGYAHGVGDGFFLPLNLINRASVVTILDNAVAGYITEPGTYSGDYDGIVIITCQDVIIENSTISGNLIVTGAHGSEDGGTTIKDSTIQGDLLVNGGGVDLIDSAVEGEIAAPEGSVTETATPPNTPPLVLPKPSPRGNISVTAIADIDGLVVGSDVQVTVETDPSGASIAAVSGDASVVTVSAAGNELTIAGIAPGTAAITVTATLNGYYDAVVTFSVTVEAAPTPVVQIGVIADVAELIEGAAAQREVETSPADATVTATSDDEGIATVAVVGHTLTVTGVAEGTATITVNAQKGGYIAGTATFTVEVTPAEDPPLPAEDEISIGTIADLTGLKKTEARTVTVVTDPAAASVTATSDATGVVTVSAGGTNGHTLTLTAVSAGTATITVTAALAGHITETATFSVTVDDSWLNTVTITAIGDVIDFEIGSADETVTVVTTPADATVTVTSGTPGVAAVTVDGHTLTITAVSAGTATITVNATKAGHNDAVGVTFTVTVVPAAPVESGFLLFNGTSVPDLYVSAGDHDQVLRVVGDLQKDIERVTAVVPNIKNDAAELGSLAIIVGSVGDSEMIQALRDDGLLDEADGLDGKWESYLLKIVDNPLPGVTKALVIVGSDKRGTAYGVYDLSEQIGVSPWHYWGDILPKVQSRIVIDEPLKVQGEPSVKYRGIFINDEQNLAYWAAKTEEKEPGTAWENGNINPDTYAKVFELLLRLKANYLWPAMHSEPRLGPDASSTKQLGAIDHFNKYPENRALAGAYGILIGTSHCEPMMRNGTAEYVDYMKSIGRLQDFNFPAYTHKVGEIGSYVGSITGLSDLIPYDYSITQNQSIIDAYWNQGVEYFKDYETSYTLGMRGLHDEGFVTKNASTTAAKRALLQAIIDKQIEMLEDNEVHPESIPIFIPYKEVLTLYEDGLVLPAETIIVWAEDNHGYIRRFPTQEELTKYAGSGVYYHLNYEGSSSYSWLNSVSPGLMLSELRKAYESGAGTLWVINAGDIKPSEISLELFSEMAWDIDRWDATNLNGTETDASFYELLAAKWFPDTDAEEVGALIQGYYHLVSILKPDHGNNGNRLPFSLTNNGDEFMQRVAELQEMAERAMELYDELSGHDVAQADAFYQHVAYPLIGTYFNNAKYYHAQKSSLYKGQGRIAEANLHADLVDWAHTQENLATAHYNTGISNGKWEFIMQPHNSNNLRADRSPKPSASKMGDPPYISQMGVVVEGELEEQEDSALAFSVYGKGYRYLDVFNAGVKPFGYTVASTQPWVVVSEESGTVYDSVRLFVTIDWATLPAGDQTATLTITAAGGAAKTIAVSVNNPVGLAVPANGYIEANGYVAMEAEHYTSASMDGAAGFFTVEGLGRTGASVSAGPMGTATYLADVASAPYLSYEVYFQSSGTFPTTIYRIPTLETSGQRFAIGVGDGTPTVLIGQNLAETGSWGTNIVNGIQKMTTDITISAPGIHTIKLYMVDAGVGVDRIVIDTGGEPESNHGPFESYHSVYHTEPGEMPKVLSMHKAYLEAYMQTVETLVVTLEEEVQAGTCPQAALDAVEGALADVNASLPQLAGDDAVRRAYGKLMSAVASVDILKNIDALLAQAVSRGDSIILNGGGGIEVYHQSAVDEFKAVYDAVVAALGGTLTMAEKMDCYEQLIVAMNAVEVSRVMRVTASSSESANIPSYATDGDPATRWAASGSSVPQWVLVDLGDVYSLDQIAITWFNNGNPTITNGTRYYRYTVSVSADGSNYTQAVDRSTNTAKNTVTDSMAQSLGRYVRIDVSYNSGGSASIFEIVITGTKPQSAEQEALAALQVEIDKAKGVDGSECTIDSYNNLMALAALGETLFDGGAAELVAQTTTNLQNAYAALKLRTIQSNDTFDDLGNVNELTEANGWFFVTTGGTVTLDDDGQGNQYLKLTQQRGLNGGNEVAANRFFEPISGKVYVEARVRTDAPQYFFGAPYIFSNKDSATAGNDTIASVALRAQTSNFEAQDIVATYQNNSGNTRTLGQFTSGQWYTVTLVLDTSDSSVQVYLDGVRKDDGTYKFRTNKDTIGKLRFFADDGTASRAETVGYIDNVLVYVEGDFVTAPEGEELQRIEAARIELDGAVTTAMGLAADVYTVDSFAVLTAAITAGTTELAKTEHLLADLEACVDGLADATDDLVARVYTVNEHFDDADVLSDLSASGWVFETDGGTVTLVDDGADNQYLHIVQTRESGNVAGAKLVLNNDVTGRIYIEAKVRSDALSIFCAPFLYSAGTPGGSTTLAGAQLRPDGKIETSYANGSTNRKQVGTYAVEEWNTICLIVDTVTAKMEVYINGVRKDDGSYVMRNKLDLRVLRFYTDDGAQNMSSVFVDDVRIYKAAE